MENQTPNPSESVQPQPPPVYPPHYEKPPRNPFEKNPFLAAILSIIPGLGNIYNGLYTRGLTFAVVCFGMFVFAVVNEIPALIPFIIFFWLFNIIDAHRQALMINFSGSAEELSQFQPEWQPSGGLILGVTVSLIGFFGAVDYIVDTFDLRFDLADFLNDFWWVGFAIFGPWLIYKTLQERQSQEAESEDVDALLSASEDSADEAEAA